MTAIDRSIHWNPHSKIIVTASKREKKRSKKERKKKRVEKNVMEYIANERERERERVVVVVAAKTQVRIALLWVSGLHWLLLLINYYYYLFIAWDWESTTSMRLRNQISFWKWSVAVETLICLSNFLSSDLYSDCSLIFFPVFRFYPFQHFIGNIALTWGWMQMIVFLCSILIWAFFFWAMWYPKNLRFLLFTI
jgi:hypothetical protein